jgi:hypothetical protein
LYDIGLNFFRELYQTRKLSLGQEFQGHSARRDVLWRSEEQVRVRNTQFRSEPKRRAAKVGLAQEGARSITWAIIVVKVPHSTGVHGKERVHETEILSREAAHRDMAIQQRIEPSLG